MCWICIYSNIFIIGRFLLKLLHNHFNIWPYKVILASGFPWPSPFIQNCKRTIYSVQGEQHSPNTLFTMVHGQAFRIVTWQPPERRIPLSTIWGRDEQLNWFEPWEPSPVPKEYPCASRVRHIHVRVVVFFVFSDFRWEVVVHFVDIGGVVEHHFINCLISGYCLRLLAHRETYFHGENKLPLDEVKTSSALYLTR